jgi:hypothetical protein
MHFIPGRQQEINLRLMPWVSDVQRDGASGWKSVVEPVIRTLERFPKRG